MAGKSVEYRRKPETTATGIHTLPSYVMRDVHGLVRQGTPLAMEIAKDICARWRIPVPRSDAVNRPPDPPSRPGETSRLKKNGTLIMYGWDGREVARFDKEGRRLGRGVGEETDGGPQIRTERVRFPGGGHLIAPPPPPPGENPGKLVWR